MQRRARIKAVANLSTSRRPANKNNSEIGVKNEIEKSGAIAEITQEGNDSIDATRSAVPNVNSSVKGEHKDDARVATEISSGINKKSLDQDPAEQAEINHKVPNHSEDHTSSHDESATFKTPLQMPRTDNEPAGSSSLSSQPSGKKFRRFKIAPRLNASRNIFKAQEPEATVKNQEETPVEAMKLIMPNAELEPTSDFTPPTPTRTRPETPRDMFDSPPTFTINNHVHHPGSSSSPFPYHSRNRTESLCSMKSNRDFTMANLQPRKNIRTEDQKIIDIKRESRERLSNKELDKTQLRMFDMIYYNPQNNPMKPRSPTKNEKPKKIEIKLEAPVTPTKEPSGPMPVPQLRLNANGEMVLDETSLIVENEQQKQNRILLASTNVVYDDDLSGNYGYYKRHQRTREWPHEETVKFYRCLNTVGSDFSLMLNLFPNRSRRDLKLKFKKEERNNPLLIDKALLKFNKFDLDGLQRELDEEEEERRKEAESKSNSEVKELVKRKILKKQEAKRKAQEQVVKTRLDKILCDGDLAMAIVDNSAVQEVKENMEVTPEASTKKRQYKKKPLVMEGVMTQLADDMQNAPEGGPKAKRGRQTRKKATEVGEAALDEPPVKKLRKTRKNTEATKPLKVEEPAPGQMEVDDTPKERPKLPTMFPYQHILYDSNAEASTCRATPEVTKSQIANVSYLNDIDKSPSTGKSLEITNSQIADLPIVIAETLDIPETSATSTSTAYFYDEFGTRLEYQVTEVHNDMSHPSQAQIVVLTPTEQPLEQDLGVSEPAIAESSGEAEQTDKTEVREPSEEVVDDIQQELHEAVADSDLATLPLPEKKSEKKPKTRKKKFKPKLVTSRRLVLDADGEMVLDEESSIKPEVARQETIVKAENASADPLPDTDSYECNPIDDFEQAAYQEIPEDQPAFEFIHEPIYTPPTSSAATAEIPFDEEAFLDSLDLEKLVLVQAQRNGKDVYEIHEIDSVTQEICDKPVNLPARIVDLIIKVMTGQEEGEDE